MKLTPVTLTGRRVRLEPLMESHAEGLLSPATDPEVWRLLSFPPITGLPAMQEWVATKIAQRSAGTWFPFAIVHLATGKAIGSTSYLDISLHDQRIEIGGTWLAREHWRTAVNTECKWLLLGYAFDHLGCLRVQLKTDNLNQRSQAAIARLGAVKEGVLRSHMRRSDGTQRDTVMFSILTAEWPAVRAKLEAFLAR